MLPESETELMAHQTCNDRITLNQGVAASIHDDGIVILHVPSGRIFTSNQTGARVWQYLEQQLPLQAIATEISREYEIDRVTAQEDTARFLAELERNGLTERGPE
jgi:hypothetical protein